MQLAGAERLARRVHRGQITDDGRSYIDHLERVVGLVRRYGGDEQQQIAAWLHEHGQGGAEASDLAALRVPRRAIGIIRALTPTPAWESAESQARRIRACPGAGLVLRAEAADLCRPEVLATLPKGRQQPRRDRYADLLAKLGEPMPPVVDAQSAPSRQADVGTLLSQLTAGNPARWTAVRALASLGELRAAPPLIDAYLAAEADGTGWAGGKAQLAGALSAIATQRRHQDDAQWVSTLVELTDHPNAFLRATGIRGLAGLSQYEGLVTRALEDDSPVVVDAALHTLDARQSREQALQLTAIASHSEPGWAWPRRLALRLLVKAGSAPGCDLLADVLAIDGMGVGRDVIDVLITQCGQEIVPRLTGQLRTRARGRAAAAFVLGQLQARDAADALGEVLSEEGLDPQVAVACIQALAKIAGDSAIPALAAAARHDLASVRASALAALSKFDHPDVTETALDASEDFDPEVRATAVRLLAARGDQRATARLLLFCDGQLAAAALRGLARIGDERAAPALRHVLLSSSDRRVRHLAGRALVRSTRHAGQLYPGRWMERSQLQAVVWVLGEIGDPQSSRPLVQLLRHRDELVRARVAAALGKIADPAAGPALHDALRDISAKVRANAATALGRFALPETRQWLEPSLGDPHPQVRSAARAALRNHAQSGQPGSAEA